MCPSVEKPLLIVLLKHEKSGEFLEGFSILSGQENLTHNSSSKYTKTPHLLPKIHSLFWD
jgi:hypothetical protein